MTISWFLEISPVGGVWVATVFRREGRSRTVQDTATADDIETVASMGAELFRGCLQWPQDRSGEISASLEFGGKK